MIMAILFDAAMTMPFLFAFDFSVEYLVDGEKL